MKATERGIAEHTVGLDWCKKPYRNHFCAGPDHEDYPTLEKMVADGHMERSIYVLDEMNVSYVYRITPKGRIFFNLPDEV